MISEVGGQLWRFLIIRDAHDGLWVEKKKRCTWGNRAVALEGL